MLFIVSIDTTTTTSVERKGETARVTRGKSSVDVEASVKKGVIFFARRRDAYRRAAEGLR